MSSHAITIEQQYAKSGAPTRASLPKATIRETLGVAVGVFLPNVAKGVIIRRPRMVAMAERLDLDRRAVRRMQRLFATASSEKRAALSHFEPKGALISHGSERADRRRFNEEVLESGNPMHGLAERFLTVVDEAAGELLQQVRRRGAS